MEGSCEAIRAVKALDNSRAEPLGCLGSLDTWVPSGSLVPSRCLCPHSQHLGLSGDEVPQTTLYLGCPGLLDT